MGSMSNYFAFIDQLDGRSYRAIMVMRNLYPDSSLYVRQNPVPIFVQVGLVLHEPPAHAAAQDFILRPTKDWTELMPGYMSVGVDNDMLISRSTEPGNDIVERNNRFYVYLKPQGANDEEIRLRSKFPGTAPVFIPMPPH